MAVRHVVFWLPTIFHDELDIKKKEVINEEEGTDGFFELSDKSTSPYSAKLKLSTLTSDDEKEVVVIVIISKVVNAIGEVHFFDTTLTSEYNQRRKNGFMQFKFDESTIPVDYRDSFKENLTNSIYQKIKEFWHEHECDTGKDSDLQPEITNNSIDLEVDDNSALIRFLESFSKLLCRNAEKISELNKKIHVNLRDYKKVRVSLSTLDSPDKQKFFKDHGNIAYSVSVLNQLIENSLIEYTYCQTLLTSIYNKSFKHDIALLDIGATDFEIKNGYRRKALNIRNAIRYIENIHCKNQNRHYELLQIHSEDIRKLTEDVRKTLDNNKRWQGMGISLAFYSALITLLFGFKESMSNCCFTRLLITLSLLLPLSILIILLISRFRRPNATLQKAE